MLPSPEHCVTTQEALEQLMEMGGFKGLGLRSRPIDLLVPTVSSRSRGKLLTCHVWNGFFPERAFIRVHERVFVSSPLFTVLQLALAPHPSRLSRRLAEEAAAEDARIRHELGMEGAAATAQELLAWEAIAREARAIRTMTDFAGTYRPATSPRDGTSYDTAPLMTCDDLKSFLDSQPSMRGARKGYGVAARAFDRSGSPMETVLALLLTLPVEMGGFRPAEAGAQPQRAPLAHRQGLDVAGRDDRRPVLEARRPCYRIRQLGTARAARHCQDSEGPCACELAHGLGVEDAHGWICAGRQRAGHGVARAAGSAPAGMRARRAHRSPEDLALTAPCPAHAAG